MSIIHITSIAKKQLKQLLVNNNRKTALFSVIGGGCNGFRYVLEPTKEPKDKLDEEISLGDDLSIRVCSKSILYLMGTNIDWRDDFMGQSFHFENPNTASTCGCGSTFSPKNI